MPLADFVGVTDLTKYRDGDAASIIAQAQATIRAYCEWHVAPSVTETLTLDGKGSTVLILPSLHVTDVTAVTNEGAAVDLADLDWSEDGYIEWRAGWWSDRPRQIEVTLEHGYDEIPADLVEVAVSIASRATASPTGNVREQAGQVNVQHATINGVAGGIALLQHEKDILDRYRLSTRP